MRLLALELLLVHLRDAFCDHIPTGSGCGGAVACLDSPWGHVVDLMNRFSSSE